MVTGFLLILYVMYTWWRDGARNDRDIEAKCPKNGKRHLDDAFLGSLWRAVD